MKTNLSETRVSQTQTTFICLNSSIITVEQSTKLCSKLTKETPGRYCSGAFIVNFEYI